MTTVLVVATQQEISPLLNSLEFIDVIDNRISRYQYNDNIIFVLTTGVGMVATAFECGRFFSEYKPDKAINLGIAGSFTADFDKGEVLEIISDLFADMGAQDGEDFLSLPELGLLNESEFPFIKNQLINDKGIEMRTIKNLKKARAITVNQVHGEEKSIAQIIKRLDPQTESMEGAAFFYACFSAGIPCAQIRAISNYVKRRNRLDWDIPLAVNNLNNTSLKIIQEL